MEFIWSYFLYTMQSIEDKEIVSRIQEVYDEQKPKSSRSFALSIDSDPSFFAKIMKGTAALVDSVPEGVIKKYGVNKEWLLKGEGEKYARKPIEKPGSIDYQAKYFEAIERERKALEDDKAFLKEILKTSLVSISGAVEVIASRQKGTGDTVLQSLERLEGRAKDDLVKEADTLTDQIDKEAHTPGNKSARGSQNMEKS